MSLCHNDPTPPLSPTLPHSPHSVPTTHPQHNTANMKLFPTTKNMEMLQAIKPTSKATLKLQCLFICKGDIEESDKLYDYFAKDMPNLPDYDPPPLTWMDNTKSTVNGLMGWIKENQDTLTQGYDFIATLIANRGMLPSIAPAAEAAEEVTEDTLPEIN